MIKINMQTRCVALTVACLLLAGSALANTVTVKNLNDSGTDSLREAIAATGNGGTINFLAGLTGTISLTSGELGIGRNVTITGPGATSLSVSGWADGPSPSRVFNIQSSATVTISGLTITDGWVEPDADR